MGFISYENDDLDMLGGMERKIGQMKFPLLFNGRFEPQCLHDTEEMAGSFMAVNP